jgi:hypothetical protein
MLTPSDDAVGLCRLCQRHLPLIAAFAPPPSPFATTNAKSIMSEALEAQFTGVTPDPLAMFGDTATNLRSWFAMAIEDERHSRALSPTAEQLCQVYVQSCAEYRRHLPRINGGVMSALRSVVSEQFDAVFGIESRNQEYEQKLAELEDEMQGWIEILEKEGREGLLRMQQEQSDNKPSSLV